MNNKYLTSADETTQLKYLLAKDDIDDIRFACRIISNRLQLEIPSTKIALFQNEITILKIGSSKEYIFNIELDQDNLFLEYLFSAPLHLFKNHYEVDEITLNKIKETILLLGFKNEKVRKIKNGELVNKKETYRIEVSRRRRY
ncbi:MAG: hypothetical protein NTX22_13200 [Ignavibacteriales bacterium]|nr:hypothetical protein [Ignavibacteriales bacterium]